jgi:hypothetical protein
VEVKGPLGIIDLDKIAARVGYATQSAMNQVVTDRLTKNLPELLNAQKKRGEK